MVGLLSRMSTASPSVSARNWPMAKARDPVRLPCSSPEPSHQCQTSPRLPVRPLLEPCPTNVFPLRRCSVDISQSEPRGETRRTWRKLEPTWSNFEDGGTWNGKVDLGTGARTRAPQPRTSPTESLLERADVDWSRIHNLLCPAKKPLRSSFRYAEMKHAMQQPESYPDYSVSTSSCPQDEKRYQRGPAATPSGFKVEIVGHKLMPCSCRSSRDVLCDSSNWCSNSRPTVWGGSDAKRAYSINVDVAPCLDLAWSTYSSPYRSRRIFPRQPRNGNNRGIPLILCRMRAPVTRLKRHRTKTGKTARALHRSTRIDGRRMYQLNTTPRQAQRTTNIAIATHSRFTWNQGPFS